MARLVIVLDVSDVDPTRMDPHEIGELCADLMAEHSLAGYGDRPTAEFVRAEWADSLTAATRQELLP